jgi:DNA-binding FadR family transcriptional regulator
MQGAGPAVRRKFVQGNHEIDMTNLKLVRQSEGDGPRRKLLEILSAAQRRGDARLPTERALTQRLRVKRGVVRQLLAELEAEEMIWRHVGRGTFIGRRPVQADADLKLVCDHSSPTELLEARFSLEPQLAAFAAKRASAAEIADLRMMNRKCAAAISYAVYEKWDESLHTAIARATRNRTLIAMFNGLNGVRREVIWNRMQNRRLDRDQQILFSRQHDEIVGAIESHDAEAARQVMRLHLESFDLMYLSIS